MFIWNMFINMFIWNMFINIFIWNIKKNKYYKYFKYYKLYLIIYSNIFFLMCKYDISIVTFV